MNFHTAAARYLPWIESGLQQALAVPDASLAGHYGMMQYHMGWRDESLRLAAGPSGKRIRPLLCLLSCSGAGGNPLSAVPAAVGLELLHDFSLIHDDIEDGSATRRHRRTVWAVWGLAAGLNAGDAMLVMAHQAALRVADEGVDVRVVLEVLRAFDGAAVSLTEGQYLDLSYERRTAITECEYFQMIAGKTGALLAAAPQIGALIAGAAPEAVSVYRGFGAALGRAFQLQDDILGIWGDQATTGKPVAADIISRKKTLPILHAMSDSRVGRRMQELYAGASLTQADIPEAMALLDAAGARHYTQSAAAAASEQARSLLSSLADGSANGSHEALLDLLDALLERRS